MLTRDTLSKEALEEAYRQYNRRDLICYDPIKYLYEFHDIKEIELVGLIASSLSFGRVTQIFKAMDALMHIVGHQPYDYILSIGTRPDAVLSSFRYRFVSGMDVFQMMRSLKRIIMEYGSVGEFAATIYREGRLLEFLHEFIGAFQGVYYLIPGSVKTSPCKRLFMFLRWMVRKDNIDVGLWKFIRPDELIIPLDTHIFRISKELGFVSRKSPSLSAAMEITANLKRFCGNDPVKYDWALSHAGIIRNNFRK